MYKRQLYNCAAVLCNGELLGLVPQMHLPNSGEFYEKRHFIPGICEPECIELALSLIHISNDIVKPQQEERNVRLWQKT